MRVRVNLGPDGLRAAITLSSDICPTVFPQLRGW
jgi:hypothetical protein